VELADGDAECVGGVVGFGYVLHVEQDFYHLLDLVFRCVAVACDRAFDLGRAEFSDWAAVVGSCEGDDASSLCDGDPGGDVFTEVEFLEGYGVGSKSAEHFVTGGV